MAAAVSIEITLETMPTHDLNATGTPSPLAVKIFIILSENPYPSSNKGTPSTFLEEEEELYTVQIIVFKELFLRFSFTISTPLYCAIIYPKLSSVIL